MRVCESGPVRGGVGPGSGCGAVRMVVAVRREMGRGAELNCEQEKDEQHRRRVLAQVTKSHAAVLHAWVNHIATASDPAPRIVNGMTYT